LQEHVGMITSTITVVIIFIIVMKVKRVLEKSAVM
jgi:hypothetical protein